jgi:Glycosyl transferases group 1
MRCELLNSESAYLASVPAFFSWRPRVVFLTDIPTPYIIEIMRELSLKVNLLCLFCAARGMNWDFEKKLGFRHFVIGGARIKRHADTTDYYISPRIFWRLLRAQPDAIISGGFSMPTLYAHLCCKLTGAKLIIYSDGTSAYEKKLGRLQHVARKVLVPRAAGFIAKSKPAADRFEELGAKGRIFFGAAYDESGAPARDRGVQGLVRRRGASPFNSRTAYPPQGRRAANSGSRRHASGPATRQPYDRRLRSQEADLRALVQSLGVHRIRFAGFVDQDDLPAYYAAADVFVFPTLDDPFGIVLLEAAASGLALVASEHAGATADFVKDGESGLIFDPHDERALAELIAKLADSPKLVRDLGLAAYNVARWRTPDRTAERYLSAITTVLADKKL